MEPVSGANRALAASAVEPVSRLAPSGIDHGELEALAKRCEAVAGPNRDLDVAIAVAVDWRWDDWEEGEATARGQAEKHGLSWLVGRATEGMNSMWRNIPRVTASLDAAMALVPEGFDWIIGRTNDGLTCHAEVGGRGDEFMRFAATPALALCAAALCAEVRAAIAIEAAAAGETPKDGSTEGESAGPQDIAQPQSQSPTQ